MPGARRHVLLKQRIKCTLKILFNLSLSLPFYLFYDRQLAKLTSINSTQHNATMGSTIWSCQIKDLWSVWSGVQVSTLLVVNAVIKYVLFIVFVCLLSVIWLFQTYFTFVPLFAVKLPLFPSVLPMENIFEVGSLSAWTDLCSFLPEQMLACLRYEFKKVKWLNWFIYRAHQNNSACSVTTCVHQTTPNFTNLLLEI